MKVIYQQSKGNRVNKGTVKITRSRRHSRKYHRIPIFHGLELDNNWVWCEAVNKWMCSSEAWESGVGWCSVNENIHSVKAAIKHLQRHDEIPKGTFAILVSNFIGCDVCFVK